MKTFLLLCTLLSAFLLPTQEMHLHAQGTVDQDTSPSESVHVQLSEEVLATGESLWFQGIVSGLEENEESKVLYVEILNSQEAVLQGIYSIKNGMVKGQIQLPDTLSGGWYQFRAYTQWMRNFEEASFWSQAILIVNPYEDNISVQQSVVSNLSPNIQFFPEGGQYVESIPNHVLVQLPEELMSSVVSARLISLQDSIPLAEMQFQSGQALFSVTPEPDNEYALEMYTSDEGVQDTIQEALPKPQQQGATVQAAFERNRLKMDVHHSDRGTYTLVLRSHDILLHRQEYQNTTFSSDIAHQDLPGGILELSVQDKEGKLLAQRVLYHTTTEQDIQIALDKSTYLPREQFAVNMHLAGIDKSAQVAVTVRKVNPLTNVIHWHKNTFGLIDHDHIPESLNEAERTAWINQILITKQSSFQPLEKETNGQAIRYGKEDESLTVSGKVEGLNGEVAGMVAVLSVPGTNPYFEYDFVKEDGSFQIPIKEDVLGKKDIVLQMADTSLQVRWALDKKFVQKNIPALLPAVPEQILKEVLEYYSKRFQIKSQYDIFAVQDTTSRQSEKKFRFYGAPNFEINLDDYIALPNFVEVNRELMPGIRLRESKGTYNLDVFDIPSRTFLPGEPSVFLDGVLVHDLTHIVDFQPSEIAFIETVNRRTYYGEYRFDGTIAIYSKEGNAYLPTLSSSAIVEQVNLYTPYEEFARQDSLQTHEPDFRTLLHWQPSVKLGSEPYTLTLKNADELGEFEIIVEGRTEDGKKIYGRKTYIVSLNDLP
ncbi:hypothetical protein [Catalinimonas niigatensis]|uniref:hypothetical protein n=1 Tax=Catalinimonas niigatensis TaxID=1397264 RepID=UPI002666FBE1|nr:hypothetical protein [Catalinimonas niigatensis]WPP48437.1 hypothetical protein PZB72_17330 [Catalinimonas niigatensis]